MLYYLLTPAQLRFFDMHIILLEQKGGHYYVLKLDRYNLLSTL